MAEVVVHNEDDLLQGTTELQTEIDEDALLNGDETESTNVENIVDVIKTEENDYTIEKEELDYDEDDDVKDERSSKFTSERRKQSPVRDEGKMTMNNGKGGNRGGHQDNRLSGGRDGNNRDSKLPNLLNMKLAPPPMGPQNSTKIWINPKFRAAEPPVVRLTLPGGPPINMMPPSITSIGAPGPIIPRLPNGMPLVALPPNHGMAGFGQPPPALPLMRPGMAPVHPGNNWDQAVMAFLNAPGGSSRGRRPRRRSRSSSYSGSSYSSRSRTRSRSSSRSSGRSSSRRRSRRDHRRDRSSGRRERGDDRRPRNEARSSRRDRDHRTYDRRSDREVRDECAKVVGVDHEYMRKLEDQKRRRDEMLKQKEMRREMRDDAPSSSSHDVDAKKKAFLCVCVKGVRNLDSALKRIEGIAKNLGSVKKCWQDDADQVNIIFAEHSSAKNFMLKYNQKVMTGVRIQVCLEKIYRSPLEVP